MKGGSGRLMGVAVARMSGRQGLGGRQRVGEGEGGR